MAKFKKKDLVGFMSSCRPLCRVVGVVPSCTLRAEL
jgi:hypothetical protein